MSTIANWAYKSKCTYWATSRDAYGKVTYGAPVVIACMYTVGAEKRVDAKGAEFVTTAKIATETAGCKADYVLAIGDFPNTTQPLTVGARTVRSVMEKDRAMFNDTPDYEILI